jgi:hypothetical protein
MPYIPEPHVTTDTICLIPHNINDRLLDHSCLHNRFSRCDWRRGGRGKLLWHLYNRWRRSILLHNNNLALCVSSHIATTIGSAIIPTLKNNRRTYLNRRERYSNMYTYVPGTTESTIAPHKDNRTYEYP